MSVIVDDIGTWLILGQVVPSVNDFVDFPVSSTNKSSQFRVSFLGDISRALSYCYIRQKYRGNIIYKWARFLPQENPQIIQIPLPTEFFNDSEGFREFAIMRRFFNYGYSSNSNILDYQIKLEQLLVTPSDLALPAFIPTDLISNLPNPEVLPETF